MNLNLIAEALTGWSATGARSKSLRSTPERKRLRDISERRPHDLRWNRPLPLPLRPFKCCSPTSWIGPGSSEDHPGGLGLQPHSHLRGDRTDRERPLLL